jgi:hypothetical protein
MLGHVACMDVGILVQNFYFEMLKKKDNFGYFCIDRMIVLMLYYL